MKKRLIVLFLTSIMLIISTIRAPLASEYNPSQNEFIQNNAVRVQSISEDKIRERLGNGTWMWVIQDRIPVKFDKNGNQYNYYSGNKEGTYKISGNKIIIGAEEYIYSRFDQIPQYLQDTHRDYLNRDIYDLLLAETFAVPGLKDTVSYSDAVLTDDTYVFYHDDGYVPPEFGGYYRAYFIVPLFKNGEAENSAANNVSQPEISVSFNGERMTFDQPPIIVDNRTLVPLRAIFEAMGATVDWDQASQTVTSKLDDITISLTIGSNTMYKNGEGIALDVPAQVVNNRTLVPIRAVSEAFGASVDWNQETKTVIIDYENGTKMNLRVKSSNDKEITLEWDAVKGAEAYIILCGYDANRDNFMIGLGTASATEGAAVETRTFAWDSVRDTPYISLDAILMEDGDFGDLLGVSNILYIGDKIPKSQPNSIEGHYELTSLTANGITVTKKGNEKFFEDSFGKDCYINLEQNGKVQMKIKNTLTEGTYTDSKIMNIYDYTIDGDNLNIYVNSNGIDNIGTFTKTK